MPQKAVDGPPWWRDIATLVAVLGLLIALTFNTLSVRQQVQQARQQAQQAKREREDNQIATFTQLTTVARQAEARLPEIEDDICRTKDPSKAARANLSAVAYEYDFLAWLFNQSHISLRAAREYWVASMLKTWELSAQVSVSDALASYPNLHRFREKTPKRLWPTIKC